MKSLAIVGGGIAGLGAAWLLKERFAITVFDRNDYAGGHSNTLEVVENGARLPVDSGFMVFNKTTYPKLTRLFEQLNVPIKKTTMSFSVQHLASGLEYNGAGLSRLFGQRRNLVRPRFWRLLLTINRFNQEALSLLEANALGGITLRDFAAERGYGTDFLDLYLVPMGAAVWSTPPDVMLDFPAETLVRFWHNHGFLGLSTHYQWWTVDGGSREYVARLTQTFRQNIRLEAEVRKVSCNGRGVILHFDDRAPEHFDGVVLACHADEALGLLAQPTAEQVRLLSPFRYQANVALLHTDPAVMPRTSHCWASWNYRVGKEKAPAPTVHYWMNNLQGVSNKKDYFVSLNSCDLVEPAKVLSRVDYTHPLFSVAAIQAQKELPQLNEQGHETGVFFCGSYFRYGFHEDAFSSGVACANAIAGETLWE